MYTRRALQVMSVAYNKLSVPTHALRDFLRFNSAAEARQVCQYYGLAAESETVKFLKADFQADAALVTNFLSVLLEYDTKLLTNGASGP